MDTRYWGPSGWRLLHLISFSNVAKKADVIAFFNTIPYILPCKYCRQSFSENILKDPIESADSIPKWLWSMHNRVNAKLRIQRLCCSASDPTFQAVQNIYEERLAAGCTRTTFEGWEFLFSIAEGHPLSRQVKASVPIQGHPSPDTLTPLERNMWNIMPVEERFNFYKDFWSLLPKVLPYKEWTRIWEHEASDVPSCRKDCLKHLWSIRRKMEDELDLLNRTTYNSLCKELQQYKSGCALNARGKTCRKKRRAS